jgi:hypothetical protein
MITINFINISLFELFIFSLFLGIPVIVIYFLVSYLRKQTKLKEQQIELLKKIANR